MTDPQEQELRDEIDHLMKLIERLQNIIARALDDMGEDGQGVTLKTKKAMLRALGGEAGDEDEERVREASEKIISAESLEWDRIS